MKMRWCVALLALAGCAEGGTRVGPAELTTLYSSQTMAYAARGGELATEIRGYPFAGKGIGDEQVAGALRSPAWHRPFRFTTKPNAETVTSYRLVLRFNPPAGPPTGERICAGEEPGGFAPAGEGLVAQGVLCANDRLASEARAYGGPVQSPADPAFQRTMNALLAELMPPLNPMTERNGSCRGMVC